MRFYPIVLPPTTTFEVGALTNHHHIYNFPPYMRRSSQLAVSLCDSLLQDLQQGQHWQPATTSSICYCFERLPARPTTPGPPATAECFGVVCTCPRFTIMRTGQGNLSYSRLLAAGVSRLRCVQCCSFAPRHPNLLSSASLQNMPAELPG